MLERLGTDHVDRALYLAAPSTLADWPEDQLDLPSKYFVLVTAIDASGLDDVELRAFVEKLLAQGAVYVCAWGPACERVHDCFDYAIVDMELSGSMSEDEDALVMTTWHTDEDLDNVLWEALFASLPSDRYLDECKAVLAVSVGPRDWTDHIRARFADVRALEDDVFARDDGSGHAHPG